MKNSHALQIKDPRKRLMHLINQSIEQSGNHAVADCFNKVYRPSLCNAF